jgi:DNA-binding transcriptional MocR family regulator
VDTISFAGDGLAPDLLPVEELADCAATALEADGARILSYGTGAGYTPLRELIAHRFGVHPFRVVITNGWLQGLALLTEDRVRSQNVVIDFPPYDRALSLLFAQGASMLYMDWHPEGLALDHLETQIRTSAAKPVLALTAPTFHNPTGQTLTLEERQRLVTILGRNGILTIEDDSYGLLRFEGEPVPTLFDLTQGWSIYSASISQAVAPGLRVGVFILPDDLAGNLGTRANDTYITPALLAQATLFELMRREAFAPHVERLNASLLERRDALLAALEEHFGDVEGVTWTRPEGGIFVVLQLTPGTYANRLLDHADGVEAVPGSLIGALPNTMRLNFAAPGLEEIEPGVERLAAALATLPPTDF